MFKQFHCGCWWVQTIISSQFCFVFEPRCLNDYVSDKCGEFWDWTSESLWPQHMKGPHCVHVMFIVVRFQIWKMSDVVCVCVCWLGMSIFSQNANINVIFAFCEKILKCKCSFFGKRLIFPNFRTAGKHHRIMVEQNRRHVSYIDLHQQQWLTSAIIYVSDNGDAQTTFR